MASKIGLISSFDTICSEASPSPLKASGLAVENAMKMSPEPLPDIAAGAGQAERGAAGQPLQLMRQQRRVGGDDDDDRAEVAAHRIVDEAAAAPAPRLRNLAAHRHAGDPQLRAPAEVGLHQHADRVAAAARRRATRDDGADAALEPVADHAGAAADVALGDRPARGAVERLEDVLAP